MKRRLQPSAKQFGGTANQSAEDLAEAHKVRMSLSVGTHYCTEYECSVQLRASAYESYMCAIIGFENPFRHLQRKTRSKFFARLQ